MANVLADMVLRLGMDSADIRKGLKNVESELGRFSKTIGGMKSAMQGAFAVAGIGIAANAIKNFVMEGVRAADQMYKLSQSVGVPTAELSAFAHAASLSGLAIEDTGVALAKLTKMMSDAATGGVKQAAVFKTLGVSVKDANGNLRGVDAVIADIATEFAGMKDGPGKTALAMELFGRSGAKLIPLLNQGASGIKAMKEEAQKLGLVISDEAGKAAEEFNDDLDRLRGVGRGVANMVVADLAPSMDAFAKTMLDAATSGNALRETAELISGSLRLLATTSILVGAVMRDAKAAFDDYGDAITKLAEGDLEGASNALARNVVGGFARGAQTGRQIDAIYGDAASSIQDAANSAAHYRKEIAGVEEEIRKLESSKAGKKPMEEVEFGAVGKFFGADKMINKGLKETDAKLAKLNERLTILRESLSHFSEVDALPDFLKAPQDWAKDFVTETQEELRVPFVMQVATDYVTTGEPQKRDAPLAPDETAIAKSKSAIESLKDAVTDYEAKIATFGQGDFAQLKFDVEFGKWAKAAKLAGKEGAALKQEILELGAQLQALESLGESAQAANELESELSRLTGSTKYFDDEYSRMLERVTSGDLREKLLKSGDAERLTQEFLDIAKAMDATARAREEISKTARADLGAVDLQSKEASLKKSAGLITGPQEVDLLREAENQKYEIRVQALDAEMALAGTSLERQKAILAEREELEQTHQEALLELHYRGIEEWANIANVLVQPAADAFNQFFSDVLDGTADVAQSIEDLIKGMVKSVVGALTQMLAKWVATKIAEAIISKTTAAKETMGNIAVAASGAYASQAAIPIVGPALGAAAAAKAVAMLTAMTAPLLAAEKGFDVPAGRNPVTQLHQREMVLPAVHADTIRELGKNGRRARDLPPIQIIAMDSRDVRRVFLDNPDAFYEAYDRAIRRRLG